jgi:hypothetical protein
LGAKICAISSTITWANRWDRCLARWRVNRMGHRVEPGLYALGSPTVDSPVFVSANYTLSFDALRSALDGQSAYILVLDTKGINVWCAAGKGTFGTDELVQRIQTTRLADVVQHRVLILPQLSASGVSAHEVQQRSGFKVEYGPVRAASLPAYLQTHEATPEMRRVHFRLWDRLVLIPVELVGALVPMVIAAVAVFLVTGSSSRFSGSGMWAAVAVVAAVLAGVVLFPILLPWLPTREFSTKGLILGAVVALPFAGSVFSRMAASPLWLRGAAALTYLLPMPAVTAFLALNFTGATTFTSRTGVKREIYRYVPVMAAMFGSGILLLLITRLIVGAFN